MWQINYIVHGAAGMEILFIYNLSASAVLCSVVDVLGVQCRCVCDDNIYFVMLHPFSNVVLQQTISSKSTWMRTAHQAPDAHHRAIINHVRTLDGINCVAHRHKTHRSQPVRQRNRVPDWEGEQHFWAEMILFNCDIVCVNEWGGVF